MNLKLFLSAGILILALLMSGCTGTGQNSPSGETANASIKIFDSEANILVEKTIQIEKGKNALDALKQAAEVKAETYAGMGSLVTSINGTTADAEHYWALYVNEAYADRAIDAYIIDKDIAIELKLEKIDFSKMG